MADINRKVAHKQDIVIGVFMGFVKGMIFGFYAFAFFVGSKLIENGRRNERTNDLYDSGVILTVIFSILTGFMTLLSLTPNI